ncbi:hypothetical protein AcdelDRAFT_3311 [Acidovorax delafieldii 2AN]|uniref:Uncharacterized protein n=1 Tax=Acidovorax delafieldii 2AN TaxID=573060 RepID=C5T8T1_ACIDE|nr:hypothetical protein [Acidovorax delafieldii]EER59110.1 hypothetical protein AcdelDRAFT_3311 [Acidovorax delafieldii 2AN]
MTNFTAPDTSRLDCKATQAAALCDALVELAHNDVTDLHTVRGLLHTMQDVLQDVQAIAHQVEFECTVVPVTMACPPHAAACEFRSVSLAPQRGAL